MPYQLAAAIVRCRPLIIPKVRLTTAFSKCYYLVLLVSSGYHLFIAHSSTLYDTPADSTNIRGRRGGISSNNNAMYGDATKSNGEFVNSIFYCYYSIVLI